jgi:hypothetical protein
VWGFINCETSKKRQISELADSHETVVEFAESLAATNDELME